jgi:predicted esterase
MKKIVWNIYAVSILVVSSLTLYAQDVVEIKCPEFSNAYLRNIKQINEIETKNPKKAIRLLEDLLKKEIKPFEECDIMFARLPPLYAEQKEYDKCLNIWSDAQAKGYFHSFYPGADPTPEYLNEIGNKELVQKIIDKNKELSEKFGNKSNAEYFVKTPKNYSPKNKYPLMIIFHGGFGSHMSMYEFWTSPRMQSEYIVVYFQGTIPGGTFRRRFDSANYSKQFQNAFSQIKEKYAVDTLRIILGGPSAGGMISVQEAMKNTVPVKGFILAFPVKPRGLDSNNVKDMVRRGVRGAIIAGENDWALKGQKEMGVIFDKYGLEHRFLVFPEVGHDIPPEFGKHIDRSLDFIWKKK